MYRQRFFLLVLPELIYGFNAAEMKDMDVDCNQSNLAQLNKQKKANHLTALSHLLLHLPKQVQFFIFTLSSMGFTDIVNQTKL